MATLSKTEQILTESIVQQAIQTKHTQTQALRSGLSASKQGKLVATCTTTQNVVAAGKWLLDACFEQLNQQHHAALQWAIFHNDGTTLKTNSLALRLEGPLESIVAFTPYFANVLNRLTSVATFTQALTQAAAPSKITYPAQHTQALYHLDILGALAGGAFDNHFFTDKNIYINDWAFQTAENHQTLFDNIQNQREENSIVTIEVVSFLDLKYALMAKPDRVVLKNFSLVEIERAVQFFSTACTILAEVTCDPNNVATFAATEVDGLVVKNLFCQTVEELIRVEYLYGAH